MYVIIVTSLEMDPQAFGPYPGKADAEAAMPAVQAIYADEMDEGDDWQFAVTPVRLP